jgi:hypothetical protein
MYLYFYLIILKNLNAFEIERFLRKYEKLIINYFY